MKYCWKCVQSKETKWAGFSEADNIKFVEIYFPCECLWNMTSVYTETIMQRCNELSEKSYLVVSEDLSNKLKSIWLTYYCINYFISCTEHIKKCCVQVGSIGADSYTFSVILHIFPGEINRLINFTCCQVITCNWNTSKLNMSSDLSKLAVILARMRTVTRAQIYLNLQ